MYRLLVLEGCIIEVDVYSWATDCCCYYYYYYMYLSVFV